MENKKHHFMVTGEIMFGVKEQEHIHSIRLNAIVIGDTDQIPVRMLGKAQQSLQLQFYQRMNDTSIEIRDVVLIGFTYLGFMTQEEFQKPPEGTEQKEVDAAADAVFGDALH